MKIFYLNSPYQINVKYNLLLAKLLYLVWEEKDGDLIPFPIASLDGVPQIPIIKIMPNPVQRNEEDDTSWNIFAQKGTITLTHQHEFMEDGEMKVFGLGIYEFKNEKKFKRFLKLVQKIQNEEFKEHIKEGFYDLGILIEGVDFV